MDWFAGALLSGLVAFVFSNFDDVIFLCLWFGQTKEVIARAQRATQQLQALPHSSSSTQGGTVIPPASTPASDPGATAAVIIDDEDAPPAVPAPERFSRWHVVAGQILGFSVLIVVSLAGFAAGSFIDHAYIGLLGIVPLLLGLYKLYQLVRSKWEARRDQREATRATSNTGAAAVPLAASTPAPTIPTPSPVGTANSDEDSALMHTPVVFHDADSDEDDAATSGSSAAFIQSSPSPSPPAVSPSPPEIVMPGLDEQSSAVSASSPRTTLFASIEWMVLCLSTVIDRNSLKVASVTMANGSDNLGIYIPLFASSTTSELVVILIVFFVLVGVWLSLSYVLLYFPPLAKAISDYGAYLVPVALIGLGFYIFWDTDVLSIL